MTSRLGPAAGGGEGAERAGHALRSDLSALYLRWTRAGRPSGVEDVEAEAEAEDD
ncbi:hypothetical protein ACH4UR_26530 [Streptomyces lydicus]|uniref:hypothetical protein n=1 Tax=Streptomyces lydicus TaxID=47763 RepID=UPI0033E92B98